MDLFAKFETGLPYEEYLGKFASEDQVANWKSYRDLISLDSEQQGLLKSFQRQINVLCFAGAWCGDCAQQCPIFDVFEKTSSSIRVRYVDRDEDSQLKQQLTICGGARVPQVIFFAEDGAFLGLYGDRTLSRYRDMAAKTLGAACPTGILGQNGDPVLAAVVQDWLDEFERIHWIVRLSPRLRQIHND